jgi:hypothetical protein
MALYFGLYPIGVKGIFDHASGVEDPTQSRAGIATSVVTSLAKPGDIALSL